MNMLFELSEFSESGKTFGAGVFEHIECHLLARNMQVKTLNYT